MEESLIQEKSEKFIESKNYKKLVNLYTKTFDDIGKIVFDYTKKIKVAKDDKEEEENLKILRKKYQKDITKEMGGLLYQVAEILNNDIYKIPQCVIKFNSLLTKTRIKIPFYGKKENWVNEQDTLTQILLNEEDTDTNLMYRNPEKPRHLLTELMWRFQSENQNDLCLIITRDSKSIFENFSSDNEFKILHFDKIKTDEYSSLEHEENAKILSMLKAKMNDKEKDDIFNEIISKIDDKEITNKLNLLKANTDDEIISELNQLIAKIGDKQKIEILKTIITKIDEKKPKIPIEKYSPEQAKLLLAPVKKHFDIKKEYKSIFYIADITEKDCMAGFEFEINFIGKNKDLNEKDKLYNFVQTIRWYLSKYVVELVNTAETIYATHGDIYKDNFFYESENGHDEGINSIIKYTKGNTNITSFDKILNIVESHFNVANSKVGLYWTGYRRWSYEVARTVAKIIDELFQVKDANNQPILIENIILKAGINLDGLNESLESDKIPHVFRQLFRGLEREKELFLLSEYRDHFIHSFYVFVMGLIFLKTKSAIIPEDIKIEDANSDDVLKKWFIVAMCHDIAYILEKGESILDKYVLNFMRKPKRKRNVLPWVPGLGNLMQIDNLLDDIRVIIGKDEETGKNNKVIKIPQSYKDREINESDIIIPIAFQHINHGIWSSLFVYHSLCPTDKIDEMKILGLKKEDLPLICRAILPHHISNWDVDKLFKDFDPELKKDDWKKEAKITKEANPLGYLLSLCDILCQAGREAPELSMDSFMPSDLNIKYKKIEINGDVVNIKLHYMVKNKDDKDKDKDKNKDDKDKKTGNYIMNEFFKKSIESLGLTGNGTRENVGLYLEISTNFYETSELGKIDVGI